MTASSVWTNRRRPAPEAFLCPVRRCLLVAQVAAPWCVAPWLVCEHHPAAPARVAANAGKVAPLTPADRQPARLVLVQAAPPHAAPQADPFTVLGGVQVHAQPPLLRCCRWASTQCPAQPAAPAPATSRAGSSRWWRARSRPPPRPRTRAPAAPPARTPQARPARTAPAPGCAAAWGSSYLASAANVLLGSVVKCVRHMLVVRALAVPRVTHLAAAVVAAHHRVKGAVVDDGEPAVVGVGVRFAARRARAGRAEGGVAAHGAALHAVLIPHMLPNVVLRPHVVRVVWHPHVHRAAFGVDGNCDHTSLQSASPRRTARASSMFNLRRRCRSMRLIAPPVANCLQGLCCRLLLQVRQAVTRLLASLLPPLHRGCRWSRPISCGRASRRSVPQYTQATPSRR